MFDNFVLSAMTCAIDWTDGHALELNRTQFPSYK